MSTPPVTPDGRYIVVRGRLWRAANPAIPAAERVRLTRRLMTARREVRAAKASGDEAALAAARTAVHAAKVALGERGPAWWEDGAPDLNRRLVAKTPYAGWHAAMVGDGRVDPHAPGPPADDAGSTPARASPAPHDARALAEAPASAPVDRSAQRAP